MAGHGEHTMITKPVNTQKKPVKLFSVREVETLKTTSAFYIPGCGDGGPVVG
jgi:hypothetical protein